MRQVETAIPIKKESLGGKFLRGQKGGKSSLVKKINYVKRNYQLYLFFTLPPLLLLIIFKYIPIGGILIAFEDYERYLIIFRIVVYLIQYTSCFQIL